MFKYIPFEFLNNFILLVMLINDCKCCVVLGPSCIQTIPTGSLPDNIDVDKDDGSLWVGCHPNLYTLQFDSENGPGQVSHHGSIS